MNRTGDPFVIVHVTPDIPGNRPGAYNAHTREIWLAERLTRDRQATLLAEILDRLSVPCADAASRPGTPLQSVRVCIECASGFNPMHSPHHDRCCGCAERFDSFHLEVVR